MARFVVAGLAMAALVVTFFVLGRPLRNRPRPPVEVSEARFQKLSPVVMGLLITIVAFLILSLMATALF